jgi:bacillolysin
VKVKAQVFSNFNERAGLYLDPDYMGSEYWFDWLTDSDDHGGVHTNCGVNNKLCYLLTDGDAFRGYEIKGMGFKRVSELYYEVQTNLLTRSANYRELYFALTQAAINLDWADDERLNLAHACQAVGIAHEGLVYAFDGVPQDV